MTKITQGGQSEKMKTRRQNFKCNLHRVLQTVAILWLLRLLPMFANSITFTQDLGNKTMPTKQLHGLEKTYNAALVEQFLIKYMDIALFASSKIYAFIHIHLPKLLDNFI